jgi:hypothetical protein
LVILEYRSHHSDEVLILVSPLQELHFESHHFAFASRIQYPGERTNRERLVPIVRPVHFTRLVSLLQPNLNVLR